MSQIPPRLREEVRSRAKGQCEYCRQPEDLAFVSHHVDHVYAEHHGGGTLLENLALSCAPCNLRKSSHLSSIDPESGLVHRLFHPRRDLWADHFELSGGEIVPRTAVGRVTVKLLRMNLAARIQEREALVRCGRL